jgi:X-X-X-Leu-X-X-Gly heptad repeat protein
MQSSLEVYIGALPTINPIALGALSAEATLNLSPDSQETLGKLMDSYEKSQYVKGAWYGPNGNDGIAKSLSDSAGTCQYLAGKLNEAANGLEASLGSLDGLQTLSTYMTELSGSYHTFNSGLTDYTQGVDTIAANYATFNYGLAQLANGVNDLRGGTSELRSGTNELFINVEDLPQTIQEQVDEFLKDYQKSDFSPTSFASQKNTEVSLVQIVLMTDSIEKEAPAEQVDAMAPVEQTFFDRLAALF